MRLFILIFILLSLHFSNRASGSSDVYPEFSSDFPKAFQQYLTSALEELYAVKGNGGSPLHHRIFGGPVDGSVYRNWFQSRVRKIVFQKDDCNYTAKIDSEGEPGVVYISSCVDQDPGPDSKMYWLSVLFHEARHLEPKSNYWKHDICLESGMDTPIACDRSPLSPYGLEKVFSHNLVQHCTNCGPEFKRQALKVFEDEMNWRRLSPQAEDALRKDAHLSGMAQ